MGPVGGQEMLVILLIALLLFGPKKLPELARMLGKAVSEFRRAKNELKSTFESHMYELERETRGDTGSAPAKTVHSPVSFPYPSDELGPYNANSELTAGPSSEQADAFRPLATSGEGEGRDISSVESPPVPDTVPRNGTQPARDVASLAKEERLS